MEIPTQLEWKPPYVNNTQLQDSENVKLESKLIHAIKYANEIQKKEKSTHLGLNL